MLLSGLVLGHAELRAVCVGLVAVVVLAGIAVTHEPLVEHLLLVEPHVGESAVVSVVAPGNGALPN